MCVGLLLFFAQEEILCGIDSSIFDLKIAIDLVCGHYNINTKVALNLFKNRCAENDCLI